MSEQPHPAGDTPPEGLIEAFWAYEHALMTDDLPELDRLFAPGDRTLRGDPAGLLVGHDAISGFRGGRGGSPQRRIVGVEVRTIDAAHALVVAVTEFLTGGRGLQTQVWTKLATGWAVMAAHVGPPAPALDRRIWRVVGDPLVGSLGSGPLLGHRVAVKDLFAVAGQPVGAGNPTWLRGAPVETSHAWAVHALIGAGAEIAGISRTDEFAYSLAGSNDHYGTPPNPAAPHRISGGSSSGSASAVSLGHATIGLGTDTGGSIRIPAAYQGLFGIRTTHDAVPRSGLMPLAPSFDAVGWLTREAWVLRTAGDALLPDRAPDSSRDVVVVPELLALADPDVQDAVDAFTTAWGVAVEESWDASWFADWQKLFVTRQAAEAWQSHGWWLGGRMDALGADVRGRFEAARDLDPDAAADSVPALAEQRRRVRELVGDRIVVLPSAPSVAPRIGQDVAPVRAANLGLTCVAGIGGLPAVSLPLRTADDLPCGVCLVAAPGRDKDLLDIAVDLSSAGLLVTR